MRALAEKFMNYNFLQAEKMKDMLAMEKAREEAAAEEALLAAK